MSVVGIGTDIVEISRISSMSEPAKARLVKRVLTNKEQAIYQASKQADRYLAKRWAAKEAAAKALGTGIAKGVSFQHIETVSDDLGKPELVLTDVALEFATKLGAESCHISISDEASYALAFVVLSK